MGGWVDVCACVVHIHRFQRRSYGATNSRRYSLSNLFYLPSIYREGNVYLRPLRGRIVGHV